LFSFDGEKKELKISRGRTTLCYPSYFGPQKSLILPCKWNLRKQIDDFLEIKETHTTKTKKETKTETKTDRGKLQLML
jgi:hypothetical protein